MRFYNTRQPKSLEHYTDLLPSMTEDAAVSVERYKKSLEQRDKDLLRSILTTCNDNGFADKIKKRYDTLAYLFRALEWSATLEVEVEQDWEELERPYQDSIYSQQELRRRIKHQITQLELLNFATGDSQSNEERNKTIQALREQLKALDSCIDNEPEISEVPTRSKNVLDSYKKIRECKKELEGCNTRIMEEMLWFDPELSPSHGLKTQIIRRDTAIDNMFAAMETVDGDKSLTSEELLIDGPKNRRPRDELYGIWIDKETDYLQFCDQRLTGILENLSKRGDAKPDNMKKYHEILNVALYLECRDKAIGRLFDAMEYEMEYEREWDLNENRAESIRRKVKRHQERTSRIEKNTGQLENARVSHNLIEIRKLYDEIEKCTQQEKIEDKEKTDCPVKRKRRWVRKMDNAKAELDGILHSHREFLSDSFLLASAKGDIQRMMMLLDHDGVNLETRNSSDETALFHAIRSQKPDAVKFLLGRGTDVNARDVNGETPLCLATRLAAITTNRHVAKEIMTLLIEAGAEAIGKQQWTEGIGLRIGND